MTRIERIILQSLQDGTPSWRLEDARFLVNETHGIRLVRPVVRPYRWTLVIGNRLGYVPFGIAADLRLRWLVRGMNLSGEEK